MLETHGVVASSSLSTLQQQLARSMFAQRTKTVVLPHTSAKAELDKALLMPPL